MMAESGEWRVESTARRGPSTTRKTRFGPYGTEATKAQTSEDKKLKEACRDFESIFMGFMLKSMRKTVTKNDLFGSSKEEEMFQDMMDDEICKKSAQTNPMGIADLLYRQLRGENR